MCILKQRKAPWGFKGAKTDTPRKVCSESYGGVGDNGAQCLRDDAEICIHEIKYRSKLKNFNSSYGSYG